jgi:hypothetical protein
MYERDGERYFIVDGHVHFWDARPENRNRFGEGFIACFYDFQRSLSPQEWVWLSMTKYFSPSFSYMTSSPPSGRSRCTRRRPRGSRT